MARKSFFQRIGGFFKNLGNAFSSSPQDNGFNLVEEAIEETKDVNSEYEKVQRIKERIQPVIDEANRRWRTLDMLDLRSLAISRAYDENDGQWGFDVSQLTDVGEIVAEATRARVFLKDRTSTPEGAELYTQQESYKEYLGQFGNQYNNWENKFKRFNVSTISEDKARIAFAAYRRLEESEQARIMAYGSENMIAAIYDMVIKSPFSDPDDIDDITDITEQARDLLSRELGEKKREFDRAFAESNDIANIIDIIKLEEGDIFGNEW